MAIVAIVLCAAAGLYIGLTNKFLVGLILGLAGAAVMILTLPKAEAMEALLYAFIALLVCAVLGIIVSHKRGRGRQNLQ